MSTISLSSLDWESVGSTLSYYRVLKAGASLLLAGLPLPYCALPPPLVMGSFHAIIPEKGINSQFAIQSQTETV